MPIKPKKINRPWVPVRKSFNTSLDNQSFYNSTQWRNVSLSFREQNPVCVECEKEGIIKASEVTDHIVSIKDGGSKFEEINFQALCHSCHNSKSGREGAKSKKLSVVLKTPKYK